MKMKYTQIMAILVSVILLMTVVLMGGCAAVQQLDPCEREYADCVHDCGEGILNDLCKEKCTYDRNQCQK